MQVNGNTFDMECFKIFLYVIWQGWLFQSLTSDKKTTSYFTLDGMQDLPQNYPKT